MPVAVRGPTNRGEQIGFLRRLLGLDEPADTRPKPVVLMPPPGALAPEAPASDVPEASVSVAPAVVACPNCGVVLDPPPTSTRLCPRCRRRIVVRRLEGRTVYLTEAAVEVFEAERFRGALEQTWTRQRRDWLALGRLVGAPADRRQRIGDAPLSAASVQAARNLYLVAVERAVREARRDKHWEIVARLRRQQAAALYEEAGGRPPPPEEIVALHREALTATLREIAAIARVVELVGAACCPACRADDEKVFKIADELRAPRLPHADCPRGLCPCDWWPAVQLPVTKRRRRRPSGTPSVAAADGTRSPGEEVPAEVDEP